MDPLLRGVCEQYIDSILDEKEIRKIRTLVDLLDLPETSREEISLGLFVGTIYAHINDHYRNMYNRPPNKDEIEEYNQILRRRAEEIKSRFRLVDDKSEPESTPEKQPGEQSAEEHDEESADEMKFSFDTKEPKQPKNNILGIPTGEQDDIPVPA
ncbi:MAG: hypothetical protein JSV27_07445 [Candidatus Bathyarchaeota archaeon]|nr:MAG: hypothetical protein JSV27_07445 [Candidatus Bathyarchaeota archaeon]